MSAIKEHIEDFRDAVKTIFNSILGIVLVGGAVVGIHGFFWGEQEGYVRAGDCRNTVFLKQNSPETWFKKFTCSYVKSRSGKVMSGTCVHLETEGPVCQTAYRYEKIPEVRCTDPNFPYIGEDDQCHSNSQ
jgi:hypothetical protein